MPEPERSEPSELEERLAAITSVTDVDISHLDIDDFLEELLQRVVESLRVDTSAVLLLEPSSRTLVARASCGIAEEVRQGVTIPMGRGFAGRIAAERRPIAIERIDATTVHNPILWQKGIKSMLGVPLVNGDRLLGVLHVGSLSGREFTGEDLSLLERVGERVVAAVELRELEIERAASRILQRSLLPSDLPSCPGFEFATRYVPAGRGGVGGDWYDVFRLPSGVVWIMAGDVVGHGVRPATVMGRLRSALRSYALEGEGPEYVLSMADKKLQFFEPGQFATVLCMMSRPPYDTLSIASAGHPPPVLAAPGQPAVVTAVPPSVLLGASRNPAVRIVTVDWPPGAVIVAYTDGLVERPGVPIDAGIRRLTTAVTATDPEEVCRRVMEVMVGDSTPRDDTALIVARRIPDSEGNPLPTA